MDTRRNPAGLLLQKPLLSMVGDAGQCEHLSTSLLGAPRSFPSWDWPVLFIFSAVAVRTTANPAPSSSDSPVKTVHAGFLAVRSTVSAPIRWAIMASNEGGDLGNHLGDRRNEGGKLGDECGWLGNDRCESGNDCSDLGNDSSDRIYARYNLGNDRSDRGNQCGELSDGGSIDAPFSTANGR
jgi:hypothetical protein